MRLFFKHVLRDALRFPLQVLLILLTVTLSVSVSVTALKTYGMFKERAAWIEASDTRLGDLLITPGASDMRALFDSDVDSMLGENDKMLGEFRLSAFPENASDHSVLSISAVDLVEADRYFEFIYTEYSTFTEENLKSSAVLSKSAAQRLGKSVGDSIDISFAGIELTYTVRAIAEDHGLLEERDMLVPISSLQSLLSEKIPSLAAFGNAFLPYTQIMIRLADKADADALAKKITSNENMRHCRVEICASELKTDMRILVQTGSVSLIAIVIIILASVLTLTCMRLLEDKRRVDYALFSAAGTSSGTINALRVLESSVYALLGGVFGIFLAHPLLTGIGTLFVRPEGKLTVGLDGALFGTLFSFTFILLCTACHVTRVNSMPLAQRLFFEESDSGKASRSRGVAAIILICLAAVSGVALLLTPLRHRWIPAVATILTVVTLECVVTTVAVGRISGGIASLISRSDRPRGKALLLFRGFENNYSLKHICMILAVSFTLLSAVNLCQRNADEVLTIFDTSVSADQVVVNSDTSISSHVKENYKVDGVTEFAFFSDAEINHGYMTIALSAKGDVTTHINSDILPKKLPKGDTLALSRGISELCEVDVGDRVTLTLKGMDYCLTVCEVIDTKAVIAFFDADSIGLRNDVCCFNLENAEELDTLREELEINGASLVTMDALLGRIYKTGLGFTRLLRYAYVAAIILTVTACVNTFCAGYNRRRREFFILRLSGMRRTGKALRIAQEVLFSLTLSLLLSLPFTAAVFAMLRLGAISFGISIF